MVYGYHFVVMSSLLIGLSTGCSVNVTNSSGNLTSPNYPGKYNRNMDCVYVITSPTKQPITLIFKDFDVEYDAGCKDDYVSIEDGNNTLLRKFCGYKNPPPLLALSGVVIIKFHSDSYATYKGFLAVFNDSQECVYINKDINGSIQSPNYPAIYSTNNICLYYIQSLNQMPINLTFTHFHLEKTFSGTCDDDYIIIQDGISESARRLGKFCGNQIPFIPVVFSGTIFVIFKSSNLTSMSRFQAEYKEEAILDCSGYLNVSAGRIQSPNYPKYYSIKTDCEYLIAIPYNGSINLTFIDFELEKQSDCNYDFVKIYDSNIYIGKFCGTQIPVLPLTLSSSIRVVFHSDDSRTFKGFYAIFSEIIDYQTTEELLSTVTVSFSTMSNTTFTHPSMKSASVNSVIRAATGVLIGMVVVIVIVCVMIDRRRRTEKNQLERKYSEKQPFDSSDHNPYNMENIDHDSTANSDGHRMENDKSSFGTEIHVYVNDTEMIKDVIVNDDVNNEYSYSNLLTTDTSNNKHLADNSYYDLSENYNEVDNNHKTCESGHFEGETNYSEYIDNGEDYNILNINPQKINDTENFDRTIQDVYDKTTHITNTRYSDLGLYDHSVNN
ncbi:bone morphogenetic protein 1-like isoform X2 [Mytilus galloprovincialis]|uniref:bone morphogenetic protein 1-like isoform X2 n=1 Tax=Mytilus galloprovincialis TaxID=29158 RepID=UPI003F7BF3DA